MVVDRQRRLDAISIRSRCAERLARRHRSALLVGIADVDAFVAEGLADRSATRARTRRTLYTGVAHLPDAARGAVDGSHVAARGRRSARGGHRDGRARATARSTTRRRAIYPRARRATTRSSSYEDVGAWLEGHGAGAARRHRRSPSSCSCRTRRRSGCASCAHEHGALDFETIEARAGHEGRQGRRPRGRQHKNRARELIEDLMIAANGATARFLEARGLLVDPPRRARAEALGPHRRARGRATARSCPPSPTRKALVDFLAARRAADPQQFADLSLSIVKLLGPGEYVLQRATDPDTGPLRARRRRLRALDRAEPALSGSRHAAPAQGERRRSSRAPYTDDELAAHRRALHRARERRAQGRAHDAQGRRRALLLAPRIGETFDAIVTGVERQGHVRAPAPPARRGPRRAAASTASTSAITSA